MKIFARQRDEYAGIVGPRITPLSVISVGLLATFLLIIFCLVYADLRYLAHKSLSWSEIADLFASKTVLSAFALSIGTSLTTLVLVMVTAIPIGYALSRYRLPGHALFETLVDAPIVLPPIVVGVSMLAFFGFGFGAGIKEALRAMDISLISGLGIVMCQYLVSISYCIRSVRTGFDSIDPRLEHVAHTLGCSQWQVFWKVSLPLAKNSIASGCIMAWARGIGVFGPLMVFVGTAPRVRVMPTTMWLELSIGNIETSLALALIMLIMAMCALVVVHFIVPGGDAR